MAKTIKFNLLIDKKPIRDIKGLENNFCIEDILEVYENGLLEKWLKVRGFNDYLEKVQNLDREQSIIIQLIKIFDIKKDDSEIKEAIYALEFKEKRKKDIEQFKKSKKDILNYIEQYLKDYDNLIEEIIKQKENMLFLKEASKEISDNYLQLFKRDYLTIYKKLNEEVPLVIYAILMNDKLRNFFLEDRVIKDSLKFFFMQQEKYNIEELKKSDLIETYRGKNYSNPICHEPVIVIDIYFKKKISNNNYLTMMERAKLEMAKREGANNIQNRIQDTTITGSIGENKSEELLTISTRKIFKKLYFKSNNKNNYVKYIKLSKLPLKKEKEIEKFRDTTNEHWKTLETSDSKVMIISIPQGTTVSTPNNPQKLFSSSEINGNFLIFNGLLYKSNVDYEPIIYMKV